MAGFAERIFEHQLSGAVSTWSDQIKFEKGEKVKSIALQCMGISANPLLIGYNQNPSTANYLLPGESKEIVPDVGNYLDGNEFRFRFDQVDGSAYVNGQNTALVTIKYEQDDLICKP